MFSKVPCILLLIFCVIVASQVALFFLFFLLTITFIMNFKLFFKAAYQNLFARNFGGPIGSIPSNTLPSWWPTLPPLQPQPQPQPPQLPESPQLPQLPHLPQPPQIHGIGTVHGQSIMDKVLRRLPQPLVLPVRVHHRKYCDEEVRVSEDGPTTLISNSDYSNIDYTNADYSNLSPPSSFSTSQSDSEYSDYNLLSDSNSSGNSGSFESFSGSGSSQSDSDYSDRNSLSGSSPQFDSSQSSSQFSAEENLGSLVMVNESDGESNDHI